MPNQASLLPSILGRTIWTTITRFAGTRLHICITDGAFTKEGDFFSPWDWKPEELPFKVFPHAVDFLAALSRHVPKRRQQTVTYAGYYANASGNLSSKPEEPDDEDTANLSSTKPRR